MSKLIFNSSDNKFKFSIIMAIYNTESYLNEAIESIINQSIGFKENIQLILINDGSIDQSENICLNYQKQYPNNILYLCQENKGVAAARNLGLKYASGEYINFLDSDDFLSSNSLYDINDFLLDHYNETDVLAIPMFYVESDEGPHELNNKFAESKILNLCKESNYPQLSISSVFIKKEAIKEEFREDLFSHEDLIFLYNILLEKKTLGLLNLASYYYRKRVNLSSLTDQNQFKKEFYLDRLDYFDLALLNYCKSKFNEIPSFIQYLIAYDLKSIVDNEDLFMCDNESEVEKLFDLLKEIINSLEDKTILENNYLSDSLKYFYFILRGNEPYYEFYDDDIILKVGNQTFDHFIKSKIIIKKSCLEDNVLKIKGIFDSLFDYKNISIFALRESLEDKITYFPAYIDNFSNNPVKYLSKVYEFKNNIKMEIPIDSVDSKISFLINFHKDGNKNNFDSNNLVSLYPNVELSDEKFLSDEENILFGNKFEENKLYVSKEFKFSIVMAIYNTEDFLYESIDSIINQTIGFEDNIQLILVDDGSQDSSLDIITDYKMQYPNNIVVISQENSGQSSARNHGLEYVKGKYVNFLDSDDYLQDNALEEIYKFFEKHHNKTDVVSIRFRQFGKNTNDHVLNYKFDKTRLIDLDKEPNNPQLSASSSFIKFSAIEDIKFPTNIVASEDSNFVNKILLKKHTLGVVSTTSYFYRKREDQSSTIDLASKEKEHYLVRLKNHFMSMIQYCYKHENTLPKFIQYNLAYDLAWLIDDYTPEIADTNIENKEFLYYLDSVISFLDEEVIIKNRNIRNHLLKTYFLYLKRKNLQIDISENNAILRTGDFVIDQLKTHYLWIDIVEIENNNLCISGFLNSEFRFENINIQAIKEHKNGEYEIYDSEYVKYTSRKDKEFLGEIWQFKNNFDLKIPLEDYESSKIRIKVSYIDNNLYNKAEVYLPIHFQRHTRLSFISNVIIKDSHILVFRENTFNIIPYSFKSMIHWERGVRHNLKQVKPINFNKALDLRLIYMFLYPFVKLRNKKIYLYGDRIDVADDNATHLFKYANQQKDNVKNYLILSKDSDDYKKMSKFGKVVDFKSTKHKLLYLFADKVISTHPYESHINPFFEYEAKLDERPNYNSLSKAKIYFLQHGVTKDNISSWMSKFDHNLSLIVTVSEKERESFFEEGYGFDEDVIQVLGFPRYDNLKNTSSKKEILIIPTWRKNLRGSKIRFMNSDYFKSLNSLLSNEDLINKCEKLGFKVVFKPHPELDSFINDTDERYRDLLDINEKIELSTKRTYQELFNDASILITDYSSVFFDFAYLKKPLIYYQPNDDYHYSESYFDYETMGFGDVISEEEDLINKIEEYISYDCNMEEKYKENVDKFFKYTDRNNCKRVYDWIKEH